VENFTIEVSERANIGKASANRSRKQGCIPGVAYHRHDQPVPVEVPYKEFTMLAQKARRSQVFTFKSGCAALNGKAAIVKEIQQDYLSGRVTHVDFQTLKDDEQITVDVPVKVVGEAPGVKVEKGILTVVTHEVSVRCLPKNIPSIIEVDVSSLSLGESIHAEQLKLGAGVVLADNPHETIVSVVIPRAAEEEAKAAEGAGATEGAAAAAPAGGAAPAAAAKAPAAKPAK
jgi:large subunit ribosomal protein L25